MATVSIPLASRKYPGLFTVVDEEDYPLVSQYQWYPAHNPRSIYAVTAIVREGRPAQLRMHRIIMGDPEGFFIDHRNGNGLDNRRENLRVATRAQNMQNQRKPSRGSSRYKGVWWRKEMSRWCAEIGINGKATRIGYFLTEEEAAHAYDRAATEAFGEFACTNFTTQLTLL